MGDVFRDKYKTLEIDDQMLISEIKAQASGMLGLFSEVKDPRSRALAQTKLEEAVMWAVKGITA